MSQPADALIVGGGPAGAALAIRLAGAGREVVLLERTAGPSDKVCGEFLSAEAIGHLDALGIGPAALGAVPIETLRLACGGQTAAVRLPFPALSLSRAVRWTKRFWPAPPRPAPTSAAASQRRA